MQEFIYYNPKELDFPVSEEIFVTTNIEDTKEKTFLISNSDEVNCELVAQEIDFYIKNSQDNLSKKISNVRKLYEVAVTKYDFAQDISYSQEITKDVLLITNNKEDYDNFISKVNPDDFELFSINEEILKDIKGHIGNLQVTVIDDEDDEIVLNVSQIVWFDAKQMGLNQSGTFDPNLSTVEEIIKTLKQNINSYSYKKFTTYNQNICQYHGRREEICSKCEEVCPTVAITKDDKTKTLAFSQIDCHGCGGCVSVCPSGAIDYAPSNKEALFEMSKFYKDTHPLVIPQKNEYANFRSFFKREYFTFCN